MHDDKRHPTIDKNNPTFQYRLANSIILSSWFKSKLDPRKKRNKLNERPRSTGECQHPLYVFIAVSIHHPWQQFFWKLTLNLSQSLCTVYIHLSRYNWCYVWTFLQCLKRHNEINLITKLTEVHCCVTSHARLVKRGKFKGLQKCRLMSFCFRTNILPRLSYL